MSTDLVTVTPDIDRDRYGRPMVIPPGGGRKVAYTRCTTFVGCLEDTYNLARWQQRMTMLGLVDRPDLLLSAAAHRDDKERLNDLAEKAIEAAKAGAAATVGTAVHALTHRLERGEDVGIIPGDYQRDLDAYTAATRPLRTIHAEMFTVCDEHRIGGTPDRVVEYDGRVYIADIKTGSVEWGAGKIAMQLAVYAHSQLYDHRGGTRTPIEGVDLERAIVIHLPAGTGTCELKWIDIAAGWEAVALAAQVRGWRARKNLLADFDVETVDPVLAAISRADTVADLTAVWAAHTTHWTPQHTQAAAARKTELTRIA